jgi:hypothetical protein
MLNPALLQKTETRIGLKQENPCFRYEYSVFFDVSICNFRIQDRPQKFNRKNLKQPRLLTADVFANREKDQHARYDALNGPGVGIIRQCDKKGRHGCSILLKLPFQLAWRTGSLERLRLGKRGAY